MPESSRGQSELIGFIMIFSAVIMAIAVLGVAGFGTIDVGQDYQRSANAERAVTALGENIDDLTRQGVPSRSTEIGLADASLAAGEATNITITVGDNSTAPTANISVTPIEYRTGGETTISYVGGAVIRQDGEHAVMLREPGFVLTEELLLLPVVETTPDEVVRVGGTSSVQVETDRQGKNAVVNQRGFAETVTIEISSPQADVWLEYFDNHDAVTCSTPSEEALRCEIEPERVVVTVTEVSFRFR